MSDGYYKTMLQRDDGKYITWNIHKFISTAWLGECPEGFEVNHEDGVKTNCRPDNLKYVTRSENVKHAYDTGLAEPLLGSKNAQHKLTEKEVIEIRTHAKNAGKYYGRKSLAKKYGVSEGHIKDIITRRRNIWPHV